MSGDETNNAIFLLCSKIVHYSTIATVISPNLTELSPESMLFNQNNARTYLRNLANQFHPTTIIQPNINNELERYLVIPIDENFLSIMAYDFLTIQASSVLCEEVFLIAGLTILKVHNRLDPKTAQAILCLKSWITEQIGENMKNINIEDIDIDNEMDYE
ncbi:14690_t:CDS:2 [Cetraspora pellucida]|uniref:14690_t:CDS:1 n=1 Tax=Cetraspora pellucida TaxID=1433469 RepID=A0ACA9L3P4_9GLOM|nr:14690_t:CDS:2 [Cetraspora pellucida]